MTREEFEDQFAFDPSNAFKIGIERECFLADSHGRFQAEAERVLPSLIRAASAETFTFELSACQIEQRVGPIHVAEIRAILENTQNILDTTLANFGLTSVYTEVGPDDMPLDVYPDKRYLDIVKTKTREERLAACRVIATHIHVGMPDHATALRVYNTVRKNIPGLCALGDKSDGKRLQIYRAFAKDADPPSFVNWKEFHEYAQAHQFEHDPRRWWGLVRISRHGTIEFRMFGATECIETVVLWAKTCRALCLAS